MKIKKIFNVILFLLFGLIFFNSSYVSAVIIKDVDKSVINDEFPESYNIYLNKLKEQHPNWVFKAVHIDLDWNEVLKHETYEINESISLVPDSYSSEWKKDGKNYYRDGNFVIASKGAVGYVLDPRNFLTESAIFQFETLNYSEKVHNIDSIEKVFWGTNLWNRKEYLKTNTWQTMEKTYSQIVLEAGKKYNISPIHIATRMKQETSGDLVNNKSINGSTVIDGNVAYNFFNIKAVPDENGQNSVRNGLIYAASQSWFTPEASIDGGVSFLGTSYINRGQNTMYFQKFDVNNEYDSLEKFCAHQYMTNILAPSKEGASAYESYRKKADMLKSPFEFHIPVYKNMPLTPARLDDSYEYEKDATYMEVYDCSPVSLNIRSGPSTSYSIIANANDGDIVLRIAKSNTSQWCKIRLENGIEGYVNSSYLKDTDIPNIALFDDCYIINRGDILTLSPFFSNTKTKEYSIEIENPVVAKVEDGKIVGRVEGQTAFKVKLNDTDKYAIGYLKVEDKASIKFIEDCYFADVGDTVNLKLEISGIEDKSYDIIVDNTAVAKIENGQLIAIGVGQTAFKVKLKDSNKEVTGYLKVTDNRNIAFVDDCYQTGIDESIDLNLKITGAVKEYYITIDNPRVARVENGKVVGSVAGQTAFTVTLKGSNKSATGYLKVVDNRNIEFINDCYQTGIDESIDLNLKITGAVKEYDIIVDNPRVARVENGKVVGSASGQTAFTVTLKGSNKSAIGYLKVVDNRNIEFINDCYQTGIDESIELNLKITGAVKEYDIIVDNPRVARVENGKVVGSAAGQTAFTVTLKGLSKSVIGYLKVVDNRNIEFINDCYQTGIDESIDLNLKITGAVKEYDITIDNPRVARVENGKVVGSAAGQTAFTVTLKGLNRSAIGYLKVVDNRTISFVNDCYITGIEEPVILNLKITGAVKEYEITVDNPRVARVEDGKLIGNAVGQTAFKVKLKGLEREVIGYLKVIDNTSLSLQEENYITGIEESINISLKIDGPNKKYNITVENPLIASVVDNKLKGVSEGQTKFIVQLNNSEKYVEGYLKVIDNTTISILEENYITEIFDYVDLKINIDGPNKKYNIIVDNPVVATVEDGKIKGICVGQTKFTVQLNNSKKYVEGYLKVEDNSEIILNNENYFAKVGEYISMDLSIFGPNKEYDIIIDNPVVATVEDGKIKATCVGQTKFTLVLKSTGKTAIGYLKVEE